MLKGSLGMALAMLDAFSRPVRVPRGRRRSVPTVQTDEQKQYHLDRAAAKRARKAAKLAGQADV